MKRNRLLYFLLLPALIVMIVAMGRNRWIQASHKATALDQAVWIARVWNPNLSMDQVCANASKTSNTSIRAANWSKGEGEVLAQGPVIDRQQIAVYQDLSVRWIPVVPKIQATTVEQDTDGNPR